MAITIHSAPTSQVAAWRPMIHEVSSDRYADDQFNVTSVSSGTGAKARYAITSHTFKVGDVVVGSTFTSISAAYNVTQTVTVVNASWIETDLDFVTSGTGAGKMTRNNENFKIKSLTYAFDSEAMTYYQILQNGGEIRIYFDADHGCSVGDYIYLPDNSNYAGWYKVNSIISSIALEVTATWSATETGFAKKGRLLGTKRQEAITVGTNIRFRFDVSGQLRSILTPQYVESNPTYYNTTKEVTAIQHYGVLFVEEFDNAEGLLSEYETKMSLCLPACRAAWQHFETQNMAAYFAGSASSKFLTRAPLIKKIRPEEEEQLSILIPSGFGQAKVAFQHYDFNGTAGSVTYSSAFTPQENRMTVVINSSMFDATSYKFDVWITNSSNVQKSEKRTFVVDKEKYTNHRRFHFENTLGGMDAYTFTGDFVEMQSTDKTEYKTQLGLDFATLERGFSTGATFEKDEQTIFSSFLNKSEAEWLKEFQRSAYHLLIEGGIEGGNVIPVLVTSAKQQVYTPNKPPQLSITYRLSNSFISLHN